MTAPQPDKPDIMTLIAQAPWREAVTYHHTWPHEYVVVKRDGQQDLLAEFCTRIAHGEGVECWFFDQRREYLFLGEHKYWTMTECRNIDLDTDDYVLNRARLYRDRRDFVIQRGDSGMTDGETDMATPQEEEVETLNVRTKWEDEALDFTPWLAENLDLLGDELGMKLELVQREKAVGPMSLDILARETDTGDLVAIENQLEWTDTHHLGQLLTYATGVDASVAIWVATEFRHEYAEALHKLNEWTKDTNRFYGVKIELIGKPGSSRGEPRFRKVVFPGGWDKDITLSINPPMSPLVKKFHDFYLPLIEELLRARFAASAVQYNGHAGRLFRSGVHSGMGYAVSINWKNSAWVTLHIQSEDNELTKSIFDELKTQQKDIESSIDAGPCPEWHWRRHDVYLFSTVNIRTDGVIGDPPEKLERIRAWMLDLLPKFKEVFDPRVENILSR